MERRITEPKNPPVGPLAERQRRAYEELLRRAPVKVPDPGGMTTEEGRERQEAQRLADRLGRERSQ